MQVRGLIQTYEPAPAVLTRLCGIRIEVNRTSQIRLAAATGRTAIATISVPVVANLGTFDNAVTALLGDWFVQDMLDHNVVTHRSIWTTGWPFLSFFLHA
jgi:hypothetical protein